MGEQERETHEEEGKPEREETIEDLDVTEEEQAEVPGGIKLPWIK